MVMIDKRNISETENLNSFENLNIKQKQLSMHGVNELDPIYCLSPIFPHF